MADDAPRDTTDIINAAIERATEGGEEISNPDVSPEPVETAVTEPAAEPATTEPVADPAPAESESDPIVKLLDEQGIKAPEPGQRENRIPYSRTVKIVTNAQKKWQSEVMEPAIKERETKIAALEPEVAKFRSIDRLATTDPEGFLRYLANSNPAYQKFLPGAAGEPVTDRPAGATFTEPKPGPDLKFQDGSTGYSQEQLDKLLDWQERKVAHSVSSSLRTEYDKRLTPFEQERQAREIFERTTPVVRAQIANVRKVYGKAFDDHQPEILKLLQADPHISLELASAQVLIPKLQANRDTMRGELLKEINGKPAVASRTTPSATRSTAEPTGPRSTEDVIKESLANAGLV